MVVHPHYIVIYRVQKETVEILRVKHTAQRWPIKG
jgi:plasmid stabilization system protein ParE